MTISVAVADDQALVRVGFCGIVAATEGFTVVGEAANGAEAVEVARSARPDVLLMDVRMPVLDGIEATSQVTSSPESAGVRVIILTTFDLDEYVFGALRAGASGFLLKDTIPQQLITAIRVVAAGDALLAPSITRRLISEFARTPPLGLSGPGAAGTGLPGLEGGQGTRLDGLPGSGAGAPSAMSGSRMPGARMPGSRMAGGLEPGGRDGAPRTGRDRVASLLTDREREVLRLVAAGMSNGEIADHLRISPATAKTHVAHLLTKLDARDRVQLVIIAYQAGLTNLVP
jgi:DNA-binding NarL/FixJ family response regulator